MPRRIAPRGGSTAMIIIYSTRFLKLIGSRVPGIRGITLFPFIILRKDIKGSPEAGETINHELIHASQQTELLVLLFALWYLVSYIAGRLKGLGRYEAYRNIIFEREAFDRMHDHEYLGRRRPFAFFNYRGRRP
jgi:hypothetical protein